MLSLKFHVVAVGMTLGIGRRIDPYVTGEEYAEKV